MDLLFKRYASPFLLLDNLIRTNELDEFISKLLDKYNEEQIYEVWLHKVYNLDYETFRKQCMPNKEHHEVVEVEQVINDSFNVLNEIKPQ